MNSRRATRFAWVLLSVSLGAGGTACDATTAPPDTINAAYLLANGTWVLEEDAAPTSDLRGPRRLELVTSVAPDSHSVFSFYADGAGREPLAVGCAYQYNRSQPDGVRFPANKEAVWVIFDLEDGNSEACRAFGRIAFLPREGEADRIYFRHGEFDYSELVGPRFSDPGSAESWWSSYGAVSGARAIAAFPYAVANGDWRIDETNATTTRDARNPSRVTLATSAQTGSESRFVFYAHDDPNRVWADCNYQVRYTMPDPRDFPADKMALWDAFEATRTNSGACSSFAKVVLFWPTGEGAMHLRYGGEGFESLLSQSLASDATTAWWARYVAF